jgi:hypothetical protein
MKRSFEPEMHSMKGSLEPNVIPNVAFNQDYPNVTMDVSKMNIPAHVASSNQDYPNVTQN